MAKLFGKFLPDDRQFFGSLDANAHTATANFDHGHNDTIADEDSFADLTRYD